MARNTKKVTIDSGRDAGKNYLLTEMSARRAEEWAIRALSGMTRSGIELPEDIASGGLAGIAVIGFKAFAGMTYGDMKPLLDEMLNCVQFISSAGHVRALVDNDIEDVKTLFTLRKEVFELHTRGFIPVEVWNSAASGAETVKSTPNTSTSQDPSQ